MSTPMPKEISEKLEDFRASVTSAAEDIIFRVFPAKILELSSIIDSTSASDSPYSISHALTSTDPRVYPPPGSPNGPSSKRNHVEDGIVLLSNDTANAKHPELVHANMHVLKLQETLKAESAQLSESCDKVRLWVYLAIPKIEDGDNFGVQVQEEVLGELVRSQESAYNIRDNIRSNYLARAEICSKLIKYPNVEDYTLALKEHDEKQLFFTRQNLIDIRNMYAVMMDTLHKNIAKIRSPRGDNRAGLY